MELSPESPPHTSTRNLRVSPRLQTQSQQRAQSMAAKTSINSEDTHSADASTSVVSSIPLKSSASRKSATTAKSSASRKPSTSAKPLNVAKSSATGKSSTSTKLSTSTRLPAATTVSAKPSLSRKTAVSSKTAIVKRSPPNTVAVPVAPSPSKSVLPVTSRVKGDAEASIMQPISTADGIPATVQNPSELPAELKVAYSEASSQIEKLLLSPLPSFRVLDDPHLLSEIKESLVSTHATGSESSNEGEANEVEEMDMGISPPLKAYLRIVGEGSAEPLSELANKVFKSFLAEDTILRSNTSFSEEKLKKILPIFLNRKRFGLMEKSAVEVSKFEDVNPRSLWVWEAPTLDCFPLDIRETARATREARSYVSRRLKALTKMQESILLGDTKGMRKADDLLNLLTKKELEEKEKRLRNAQRKKQTEEKLKGKEMERIAREIEKKKKEELKKQLKEAICTDNAQLPLRKQKKKETNEVLEEAVPVSSVDEKRVKDEKIKRNQQSLMMRWLKREGNIPDRAKSHPASFTAVSNSVEIRDTPTTNDASGVHLKRCNTESEETMVFDAMDDGSYAFEVLDEDTKRIWADIQRRMPQYHQLHPSMRNQNESIVWLDNIQETKKTKNGANTYMKDFCDRFAKPHTQLYLESTKFYFSHRLFRQDIPAIEGDGKMVYNDMTEKEVRSGLIPSGYGNENYRDALYLRTVCMNDHDWKRPAKHLLIGKLPEKLSFTNPTVEEAWLDYETDSDDEWFEAYDAEDLDERDEEDEEEEVEEEDDFIVPDEAVENILAEISTHTASLKVEFEGLYDWEWWFEGNLRRPNSLLNENGDIEECLSMFGCVRNNCGTNPFNRVDAEPSLPKGFLESKHIIELLKHCHGKQMAKQNLIEEFRSFNMHLTKADIERKFRLYLTHEKRVDNKKAAWYVKEDAVVQFNLQDSLPSLSGEDTVMAGIDENNSAASQEVSSLVCHTKNTDRLLCLPDTKPLSSTVDSQFASSTLNACLNKPYEYKDSTDEAMEPSYSTEWKREEENTLSNRNAPFLLVEYNEGFNSIPLTVHTPMERPLTGGVAAYTNPAASIVPCCSLLPSEMPFTHHLAHPMASVIDTSVAGMGETNPLTQAEGDISVEANDVTPLQTEGTWMAPDSEVKRRVVEPSSALNALDERLSKRPKTQTFPTAPHTNRDTKITQYFRLKNSNISI